MARGSVSCPLLIVFVLAFDFPLGEASDSNNALAIHLNDVKARALGPSAPSQQIDTLQVRRLMSNSAHRRPQLATLLKPLYATLPQSARGELGDFAYRYALHRLFSQRHGWILRGLQASSETWEGAEVKLYIKAVVSELGADGRGLTVQELAVVAGVIEELTHEEAVSKLHAIYSHYAPNFELDWRRKMPEDQVALFVAMTLSNDVDAAMVDQLMTAAWNEAYIGDWTFQKHYVWLLDVQFGHAHMERDNINPFLTANKDNSHANSSYDFDFAVRVIEQVGARHGKWQNLECHDLKSALVELDQKSIGRVPLPDFYGAQMWGTVPPPFQFIETEDYLRHLGALDETDPGRPGIMVPNYVNAFSNCILSTDVYSVCCIDECEQLLGQLEAAVEAPSGSPEQIAKIVANMSSDTVRAPRELSGSLLTRLSSIAALEQNNGTVPLHSRLFAQWLHHAYPYECAYPHSAVDGVWSQTTDAWLDEQRRLQGVIDVSGDEIEFLYAQVAERHSLAEGADEALRESASELRWTDDDRSPFHHAAAVPFSSPPPAAWTRVASACAAAALLVSAALQFLRTTGASAVSALGATRAPPKGYADMGTII